MSVFLMIRGREFHPMAHFESTLFLFISHLEIIVLKSGAVLALVFTFLMSSRSVHCFFLNIIV